MYLKGGDVQIDLAEEMDTSSWDYNGSLFFSVIVGLIASNDYMDNIEKFLQLSLEPEILFKVDGNFDYKDSLQNDIPNTIHEMGLLFKDLADMYNGNYSNN